MKKSWSQKQIPTLLGIGVLVLSLIAGIFFIGTSNVFAPRATPQTTPKNIKITNVKDTGFTVSFLTDESTAGFVKYGVSATDIKNQAGDDRDQLSGSVGQFSTHYVTVRDLQPDTTYYFTLGTTSVNKFDNNGAPFSVKTAKRGSTPPAAKTIYGNVNNSNNTPAEGAIVFLNHADAGELSALVRNTGTVALPLSGARKKDGSGFAQIENTDKIILTIQGTQVGAVSTVETTVADAQPFKAITIGSGPSGNNAANARGNSANAPGNSATNPGSAMNNGARDAASSSTAPLPLSAGSNAGVSSVLSSDSAAATPSSLPLAGSTGSNMYAAMSSNSLASASAASGAATPAPGAAVQAKAPEQTTVDLSTKSVQEVDTQQPTIVGKAAPNVTITIEVNSETKIVTQVQADAQGKFSLDLLTQDKKLEPGTHTVKITYTDPVTKMTKTETQTFTVAATAENTLASAESASASDSTYLAQATTATARPFGSGNPYTIPSPTLVATASPSTSTGAGQTRITLPATTSGVPKSGSVTTTIALLGVGMIFILAGSWSYVQAAKAHTGGFGTGRDEFYSHENDASDLE